MKRTYISPKINIHKLQALQLLAGSDPDVIVHDPNDVGFQESVEATNEDLDMG